MHPNANEKLKQKRCWKSEATKSGMNNQKQQMFVLTKDKQKNKRYTGNNSSQYTHNDMLSTKCESAAGKNKKYLCKMTI